jgi:hypothetical protein
MVKVKTKRILLLWGLTFLLSGSANTLTAATIWSGPRQTFTKADFANYTLPANQDRITAAVWLTRSNAAGLYNVALESGFNQSLSPINTAWAYGSTSNYAALAFTNWNVWSHLLPPDTTSIIGHDAVVHLISENIYIDIKFTAFTGGGPGGGFAYERSGFVALSLEGPTLSSVSRFGTFTDPGATASNSAGIPLTVAVAGTVDTAVPGDYLLTYSATDTLGFTATTNRLVSVLETNSAPSWWLLQYSLGTNDSASITDSDEDGIPNWAEFVAGTDPTNKSSVLRLDIRPDGALLEWPSLSGRSYSLYQTTNLAMPFSLVPGGSNLTAFPPGNTFSNTDASSYPSQLFKIGVRLTE